METNHMTRLLNILVVDDDIDNAQSLGELFEMEGHAVSVVHSGQAAIDAYVGQSFDIAFMDIMMPGKNGVESFLEIRSLRPNARVFMMSGYSVEELLQQALRGGALGMLEKPFEPSEVLRLTESVGPGGLVVNSGFSQGADVGKAIHEALNNSGRPARLIRTAHDAAQPFSNEEVLVVDTKAPLIDEVSMFTHLKKAGHAAPTILVPPSAAAIPETSAYLRNVDVTGILNKPFDPEILLQRLPVLAA